MSANRPVTVRFAPSPTGKIHIGNVRTATLNWLFARAHSGTFILRLDDTDRERSTEAFAEGIRRDVTWLGLNWQREERQSARFGRYAEVAEKLKASGRLYRCYETEDELEKRRQRLRLRGLPPVYDRAALALTDAEHKAFADDGIKPYWRFLTKPGAGMTQGTATPDPVLWPDAIRGDQTVELSAVSDPVLVRADGTPTYTFASVVDDADMGVTHIIRGEDHVTNTGVQIRLFEAIGAIVPTFAHHALLVDAEGKPLSKRLDALSVEAFRTDGFEPKAVVALAALIGTQHAVTPEIDADVLARRVTLDSITRAPARFGLEDLQKLNAETLALLPFEAVESRIKALGIAPDAQFWSAVRSNISKLDDVKTWWEVVSGKAPRLDRPTDEQQFLAQAAALLPAEPFTEATWGAWTDALKAKTGAKGKALFMPLRKALTGRETGPEMKVVLSLMARKTVIDRLA
ncbi:MAG: hypothetical protein RL291_622 [Pseudomonadota bacterium]